MLPRMSSLVCSFPRGSHLEESSFLLLPPKGSPFFCLQVLTRSQLLQQDWKESGLCWETHRETQAEPILAALPNSITPGYMADDRL